MLGWRRSASSTAACRAPAPAPASPSRARRATRPRSARIARHVHDPPRRPDRRLDPVPGQPRAEPDEVLQRAPRRRGAGRARRPAAGRAPERTRSWPRRRLQRLEPWFGMYVQFPLEETIEVKKGQVLGSRCRRGRPPCRSTSAATRPGARAARGTSATTPLTSRRSSEPAGRAVLLPVPHGPADVLGDARLHAVGGRGALRGAPANRRRGSARRSRRTQRRRSRLSCRRLFRGRRPAPASARAGSPAARRRRPTSRAAGLGLRLRLLIRRRRRRVGRRLRGRVGASSTSCSSRRRGSSWTRVLGRRRARGHGQHRRRARGVDLDGRASAGPGHQADGRDGRDRQAPASGAQATAAVRAVVEVSLAELVAPWAEPQVLDSPRQRGLRRGQGQDLPEHLELSAGLRIERHVVRARPRGSARAPSRGRGSGSAACSRGEPYQPVPREPARQAGVRLGAGGLARSMSPLETPRSRTRTIAGSNCVPASERTRSYATEAGSASR